MIRNIKYGYIMNRLINLLSLRLFIMMVKGGGEWVIYIFKKKFIIDIIDIRIFV